MSKVTSMSEVANAMEKEQTKGEGCVREGRSLAAMWASGEVSQAEGAARADLEVGACLEQSRDGKEVSVAEERGQERVGGGEVGSRGALETVSSMSRSSGPCNRHSIHKK